jgi:uncharacterized membrane protein
MGVTSFAYKLVLLLHILSAIIGFGGVLLNGVYAARAKKRPPAEALAVVEANAWVSIRVAEIFIYLTAVFGLGLLGLSDKVWKFSQTWVWLALVVYVVALGISHGLLMPRVKKLIALMRAVAGSPASAGPPPEAAEAARLEPQIGGISVLLDVALVAILVLMIWKPGV